MQPPTALPFDGLMAGAAGDGVDVIPMRCGPPRDVSRGPMRYGGHLRRRGSET